MLPLQLTEANFLSYPPQAKQLGLKYLLVLRQLPLCFLPSLLRELIVYDYGFPAERVAMDRQLGVLAALTPQQLSLWFQEFAAIRLTTQEETADWVGQPTHFTEDLSAYLWATHQMDAFRMAATTYSNRLSKAEPPASLPTARLGIVVIGKGVTSYDATLFTNLRQHGTYFSKVDPQGGLEHLLSIMAARARLHPTEYAHWYVDGAASAPHDACLTSVSYANLAPARTVLLKRIEAEVGKPGMGPEQLRSYLMRLSPADLHMAGDALLDRFQIRLLTDGSGTQIFSTTFVQWTAREVLRRAQPLSLLVRYAPRQRQRPMHELLSSSADPTELDPVGSLVDGDMGAYYQWIDQQRLPGASYSSFVVWFEGHSQALAIGPALAKNSESTSIVNLRQLVSLATG
ncbi:MAG: hypothetical protein ACRYGF_12285 [Janthinobacterium lividum]